MHAALWFFLRDQVHDKRKLDGEPTCKLRVRICKPRGKIAVKKTPPKKAASIVAVETQEGHQRSPRHRRPEISSLDASEGTSGVPLQGPESEYSDQDQD